MALGLSSAVLQKMSLCPPHDCQKTNIIRRPEKGREITTGKGLRIPVPRTAVIYLIIISSEDISPTGFFISHTVSHFSPPRSTDAGFSHISFIVFSGGRKEKHVFMPDMFI